MWFRYRERLKCRAPPWILGNVIKCFITLSFNSQQMISRWKQSRESHKTLPKCGQNCGKWRCVCVCVMIAFLMWPRVGFQLYRALTFCLKFSRVTNIVVTAPTWRGEEEKFADNYFWKALQCWSYQADRVLDMIPEKQNKMRFLNCRLSPKSLTSGK